MRPGSDSQTTGVLSTRSGEAESGSYRIHSVDALRGCALLGMLVVNIGRYVDTPSGSTDLWVARLVEFWMLGKFYPIFAMLFGFGFYAYSQRFNDDFVRLFSRRLLGLGLIGLGFYVLVEDRSVLVSYAVLGFVLVPLRNTSSVRLLSLAFGLVFVGAVVSSAESQSHTAAKSHPKILHSLSRSVEAQTYMEGVNSRAAGLVSDALEGEPFIEWPVTLATILLGFVAGREQTRGQTWHSARSPLRTIGFPALLTGFLGSLAVHLHRADSLYLPTLVDHLIGRLSEIALSVSYAIILLAIFQHPAVSTRFRIVAAAGRMALTNYVLQCALFVVVFSAYGMHVHIGWKYAVIASCVLWLLQLVSSHFWLRVFPAGPLESMWKLATYGHQSISTSVAFGPRTITRG